MLLFQTFDGMFKICGSKRQVLDTTASPGGGAMCSTSESLEKYNNK